MIRCPTCGLRAGERRFDAAHVPDVRVRLSGGYRALTWTPPEALSTADRQRLRFALARALHALDANE